MNLLVPPEAMVHLLQLQHPKIDPIILKSSLGVSQSFEIGLTTFLSNTEGLNINTCFIAIFSCSDELERIVFSDIVEKPTSNFKTDSIQCEHRNTRQCTFKVNPSPHYWIRTFTGNEIINPASFDGKVLKAAGCSAPYALAALLLYEDEVFKCSIVLVEANGMKFQVFPPEIREEFTLKQIFTKFTTRIALYEKNKDKTDSINLCIEYNSEKQMVKVTEKKDIDEDIESNLKKSDEGGTKIEHELKVKLHEDMEVKGHKEIDKTVAVNNSTGISQEKKVLNPIHELKVQIEIEEGNIYSGYVNKAYQTTRSGKPLQYAFYDVTRSKNDSKNISKCNFCDKYNPKYLKSCLSCSKVIEQNNN